MSAFDEVPPEQRDGDTWPHHAIRQYHRTPRGRWTRELVVGAIRAWADEVGAAPLTRDWDPSTARSAGLIGAAPTKFERERDRWPSTTIVYQHFASWHEACDAAGISASRKPRPDGPVAERVRYARRRRADGLTYAAIAAELDVREPTAWRYVNSGDCEICGEPVATTRGRCTRCAAKQAQPKRWSEREVLDAATAWRREVGALPTANDWLPGSEKWDREAPRWPTAGAVRVSIGGFQELRMLLGEAPHHPGWPAEMQLDAIRRYVNHHGESPRGTDLAKSDGKYPTATTLAATFGSFDAAIIAAGFTPRSHAGRWDAERILSALLRFERDNGRMPKRTEWRRSTPEHPTDMTVVKVFGSFGSAIDAALAREGRKRRSGGSVVVGQGAKLAG